MARKANIPYTTLIKIESNVIKNPSLQTVTKIAEKLAKKFNTQYKSQKGIDLVTQDRVIEVETKKDGIYQGIKQVEKSSKARYLAVNKPNIKNALEATQGTGIEVLNESGNIIKKASRK